MKTETRLKFILLLILNIILTTVPVYAKGNEVTDSFKINSGYIYLDNKLIDGESLTYKGVTYLPVRKIAESMGLNVKYDKSSNRVDLVVGGTIPNSNATTDKYTKTKTGKLLINNVDVFVNDGHVNSDNVIYNGTTYLPLRKIAETVGLEVVFDTATNNINLTMKDNVNNSVGELKPVLTIEEINFQSEPKTVEEFKKVLLFMANNNLSELDIRYKGNYFDLFVTNKEIENNLYAAFHSVFSDYVDLYSGVEKITKTYNNETNGEHFVLTIHIKGVEVDNKPFTVLQSEFEEQAFNINEDLKKNGTIKSGMTQKEIAKSLYTYVDKTLTYDYATENETNVNKASYLGYGAVKNKVAVCQGYTALYNYLLKLNGIKCYGQSGDLNNGVRHIWTVAILDGNKTYIDTTFGDTSQNKQGDADYKYFDITKEELSKDRTGVN